MADRVRHLRRTRRAALRFASDARELARRGKLAPGVQEAIAAACDEVEAAAREGEPAARLSAALRALDGLWDAHLARLARRPWRAYALVTAAAIGAALLLRALVVEGYRVRSGAMAPTLLVGDRALVSKLAYGLRIPFTRLRLLGAGPRRGDVVVLERPRGAAVATRVVGLPGDVVELRDQVLWINGVPQPRTVDGEVAYEDRGEEGGPPHVDACRRAREALARGPLVPPEARDPGALEASWQAAAGAGVATHDVLQCRPARLAEVEGPWGVVEPGHVLVLGDNRDRAADGRREGARQVPIDRIEGRVSVVWWSWGAGGVLGGRGPRPGRLFKRIE